MIKCALYTTARKKLWPMRLFYGMIHSAALNAFVIFTENVPNFREHKKNKRQKFFKELALALIIPHARQSLEVQQTPHDVKQVPSQAKVLTGGGDLREAQVDVPLSVSHSCV